MKMAEPYEQFKAKTNEGATDFVDTPQDENSVKAVYAKTKNTDGTEVYDAKSALEKFYKIPPQIIKEAADKIAEAKRKIDSAIDPVSGDVLPEKANDLVEGAVTSLQSASILYTGIERYAAEVKDQDARNRYAAHQVITGQQAKITGLDADVARITGDYNDKELERAEQERLKLEAEAEVSRLQAELAARPAINAKSLKDKLDAAFADITNKLQPRNRPRA